MQPVKVVSKLAVCVALALAMHLAVVGLLARVLSRQVRYVEFSDYVLMSCAIALLVVMMIEAWSLVDETLSPYRLPMYSEVDPQIRYGSREAITVLIFSATIAEIISVGSMPNLR